MERTVKHQGVVSWRQRAFIQLRLHVCRGVVYVENAALPSFGFLLVQVEQLVRRLLEFLWLSHHIVEILVFLNLRINFLFDLLREFDRVLQLNSQRVV